MNSFEQINQMPVLYKIPGMERVSVRRGTVYKETDEESLKLDAYYPPDFQLGTKRGAVVFIHGGSQPEHVQHIERSQPYSSWCRLVAASGFVAIMFKHRTDEGYAKLHEAASDVDDLIVYVREHSEELSIDADKLAIWTASSGPIIGLRTILRDKPVYIRGIAIYNGVLSLLNRAYFTFSNEEKPLIQEFSPVYHLSQQRSAQVAPLFVVKAGRDREFLNDSIDEFVTIASRRNIPITFMNHPTGEHGFDILNNDARTKEIIKATLAFFHEHF
jgi:acetyl esterase/lipase